MIDRNFIQFVRSSCGDALTQNGEYMKLQSDYILAERAKDKESAEEIHNEMEARAEEICFIAGFNAAMQFILKGVAL